MTADPWDGDDADDAAAAGRYEGIAIAALLGALVVALVGLGIIVAWYALVTDTGSDEGWGGAAGTVAAPRPLLGALMPISGHERAQNPFA